MGMISYLYKTGTQVVSWEKNNYVFSNESSYYWGAPATISQQTDKVVISAANSGSGHGAKWVTSNAIDATNISKLYINVTARAGDLTGYGVARSLNGYCYGNAAVKSATYTNTGLKSYDFSALTGDIYISLFCMINVTWQATQTVDNVYLEYLYDYTVVCDSNKGSYSSYNYLNTFTLNTISNNGYAFKGYYVNGSLISRDSEHTFTLDSNVTVNAEFYEISIVSDSYLGTGTYVDNGNQTITLSAVPTEHGQFVGWYVNSTKLSGNATYTYFVLNDVTIEARFEKVWDIDDRVDGNGAIQYTRGNDKNDVTFSVIPNANHHFVKYEITGLATEDKELLAQNDDLIVTEDNDVLIVQVSVPQDYESTPLYLHLRSDITIVAYFEEDDKYHITASTNVPYVSVYISDNDVYSGTVVTLWARPFPDYNFVKWGDGTFDNPKSITVTENVTIVAEYQRILESNGIYQYRCFVKDQLDMEGSPKAFMVVDSFDVKRDTMTKATSSIAVLEMAGNINDGDVLVLYDPKGTSLYNGVINSIQDKTLKCSQMPSFYKGTWIYNTSSQSTLEQEIAVLLQDYADGKMFGATWVDSQVAQRLGGITIDYVGATSVNLPTDLDDNGNPRYSQKDMEDFIYELYEKYNIIFDFEINISGTNYVHIKVPTFTPLKVGNNMYAIKDMSPITTIEETNKLIIYAQDKTYRATYIATKNDIVKEPSTTANRFDITNTAIVFSDDPEADLVANNLPETMYNHKLTFTLIIKNFIYQFGDFKLGGSLDVYHNDDYYNSVLTGYQIKKSSNRNITEVAFTCGKVRNSLTNKLTLRRVL